MGKEHEPILTVYQNLMQEIKWRIESIWLINGQLGKSLNTLQHFVAAETYLLQLRMVFETIALGCMIAHGNVQITKAPRLQKAWQADYLIKQLLKHAHDGFFPVAREWAAPGPIPGSTQFGPETTKDCLTPQDLVALYGTYGDYLHRGSLKNFEPRRNDVLKALFKDVGNVGRATQKLLNLHTMKVHNSTSLIACTFEPLQVVWFDPAN